MNEMAMNQIRVAGSMIALAASDALDHGLTDETIETIQGQCEIIDQFLSMVAAEEAS